MTDNKIKATDIKRIVIVIRQKKVFAFVEGCGRVLVADGDAFKTDWKLKEIVDTLNG